MNPNQYACNRKKSCVIGGSFLIDKTKEISTDITVWFELPSGESCEAVKKLGE